jgi:RNA-binding protein PNO1
LALSPHHIVRVLPWLQIPVPQNRMTPLKTAWMQLYTPITDNLKLDMRMNLKTKKVRMLPLTS